MIPSFPPPASRLQVFLITGVKVRSRPPSPPPPIHPTLKMCPFLNSSPKWWYCLLLWYFGIKLLACRGSQFQARKPAKFKHIIKRRSRKRKDSHSNGEWNGSYLIHKSCIIWITPCSSISWMPFDYKQIWLS